MAIDFALDESQELLRQNLREFFERECPPAVVRQAEASELSYAPELWQRLARTGFLGLGIPEAYGGSGSTFLDLGLFCAEAGRVLLPGPHLATLAIAAQAIVARGTEEQKRRYLSGIADGRTIFALAIDEREGESQPHAVQLAARREGDAFVLDGAKMFVKDTAAATHLLVVARTSPVGSAEDGLTAFLVDASLAGITTRRFRVISGDLLAEVRFEQVRVATSDVLGAVDRGWLDLGEALDKGKACLAAQMAGAADALMWQTVAYMNQRHTFGHPIASYQALQHRMAYVAQRVYGAQRLAQNVLWKLDQGIDCSADVALAKAFASDTYRLTTDECHQFHGAFGYSLEHVVQLYWRRTRLDEVLLGDPFTDRELAARAAGL